MRGLVQYFDTPARGAWRDKLKADGGWVDEPAPGSSLYHITCAMAELIDAAEAGEDGSGRSASGDGGALRKPRRAERRRVLMTADI